MGAIVNLKLARKRRERAERQKEADAKRVLFGRTASQADYEERVKSLESRKLDAAQRDSAQTDE